MKNAVLKSVAGAVLLLICLGCASFCPGQTPRTPPSRPNRPPPPPRAYPKPIPTATIKVSGLIHVLHGKEADVEINNLTGVRYSVGLGSTGQAPCGQGWVSGSLQLKYDSMPVNGKLRLKFDLYFYQDAAGSTCPIHIYIAAMEPGKNRSVTERDTKLDAGTVHIESTQTYRMENTWDVVPFGVNIKVSLIGNSQGACTGISTGLSGIIPIGVVKNGDDLSLHIRSGIFSTQCMFDLNPPFQLKDGWAVTERIWKMERERGDRDVCRAGYSNADPSGASFYVHAQMECAVGPDNNNGIRLTLQSITLVGPPNQTYEQAFR